MNRFAALAIPICLLLALTSCITSEPTPTTAPGPSAPQPQLLVHFINVGQGDSILIDFGETEVLVDGGDRAPGIVSYLREHVDGPLEVMVATHPHADHIGGLIKVLGAFQVQQIWHNGDTSESKTYADFMTAVNTEGAQVYIGKRGDAISAGTLTFLILNPGTLAGTTNNNSLVLSLSYGMVDFLFMGDAEKEAERAMLVASDIPIPDVEILKVGHHGSRTASLNDFLTATTPVVAVYMAGKGNSYGHPHQETIDALNHIGAKVYGTDVNGTNMISTNGDAYSVATEK